MKLSARIILYHLRQKYKVTASRTFPRIPAWNIPFCGPRGKHFSREEST